MTKQQPRGKPFDTERGRLAGQTSRSHGLDAIANRGADALLDETAAMDFRELRLALRDPAVREQIKLELTARLIIMSRVGFDQMGVAAQQGGDPFSAPVVKVMGGYLNLLVRLLNTFPQQDRADSYAEALERINRVIDEHEQAQVGDDLDSDSAPHGASGSARGSHSEEESGNE